MSGNIQKRYIQDVMDKKCNCKCVYVTHIFYRTRVKPRRKEKEKKVKESVREVF